MVKKVGSDIWLDFFIPECDIYNPIRYFWYIIMGNILFNKVSYDFKV